MPMRIARLLAYSMVLSVVACNSYGGISPLALNSDLGIKGSASLVEDEQFSELSQGAGPVDGETVKLDPAFNVNEIAFELMIDLAGYRPEQLAGVVPDLAGIIIDAAIGSLEVLEKGKFLTFDSHFGEVATKTDRTAYQCGGGGMMILEVGEMRPVNLLGIPN